MNAGKELIDELLEDEDFDISRIPEDLRLKIAGLMVTIRERDVLRPAISCKGDATVREAIEHMHREHMGFILVLDGEALAGVFTERDLLTTIAENRIDIDTTPVSAVMTARPECLGADYQLVYAINQMSIGGYRHIPVLNEHGQPVHVISARNVIEHLAAQFPKEVLNLPPDPGLTVATTAEGA